MPGGGGVVAETAPLVAVEAVTSRVSVLPVVGSDLLTGLSVAAGGADQLREMVQQPVPENSETIDIEQLLRRLLPVDTEIEETEQPTSEAEKVDDRASGNVA